jgi:hypothetical protein
MAHTRYFGREYEGNLFPCNADIYQTARRHNPEDLSVKSPGRESLRTCIQRRDHNARASK